MSRWTHSKRTRRNAGFTLIEVVIALAVIAVVLASIGSVVSVTARGAQALDDHLVLVETARAIETGLPDRTSLAPGTLTGELRGQRWRVDVQPFPSAGIDSQPRVQWVPLVADIVVQSPDGTRLRVTTLRLRHK